MTLNQLITDAMAISRNYTTGDIPLMMCGTEVDITLTGHGDNGCYVEVDCMPTQKEKPREITRKPVTPIGSDGTQGYVVLGAEGMKVRDFIAYCCDKYNGEHGDFSIMYAEDGETFATLMRCNYHNGSIDAKSIADKNFEKAMGLVIAHVRAGGGWDDMDYTIYCKDKED